MIISRSISPSGVSPTVVYALIGIGIIIGIILLAALLGYLYYRRAKARRQAQRSSTRQSRSHNHHRSDRQHSERRRRRAPSLWRFDADADAHTLVEVPTRSPTDKETLSSVVGRPRIKPPKPPHPLPLAAQEFYRLPPTSSSFPIDYHNHNNNHNRSIHPLHHIQRAHTAPPTEYTPSPVNNDNDNDIDPSNSNPSLLLTALTARGATDRSGAPLPLATLTKHKNRIYTTPMPSSRTGHGHTFLAIGNSDDTSATDAVQAGPVVNERYAREAKRRYEDRRGRGLGHVDAMLASDTSDGWGDGDDFGIEGMKGGFMVGGRRR